MNTFNKNKSSAAKGAKFENDIFLYLTENLPTHEIIKTSTIKYSGDILIKSSIDILIETKNYTNSVPSAEVDKFIRDIKTNTCAAGIFISMNSAITGKK